MFSLSIKSKSSSVGRGEGQFQNLFAIITRSCEQRNSSWPFIGENTDPTISAVDSTPESVTTDADQTLTCKIGGLDVSHPVTVAWKDPDNAAVSETDTNNYVLSQGTVDGTGNQEALLTIKTAKLSDFNDQTSFTYTCSVTSSQYPESPASTDVDVIANIEKTLGEYLIQLSNHYPNCQSIYSRL